MGNLQLVTILEVGELSQGPPVLRVGLEYVNCVTAREGEAEMWVQIAKLNEFLALGLPRETP